MERRDFLKGSLALGALASVSSVDSLLAADIQARMKWGVCSITWGDDIEGCLTDSNKFGYQYVQLRGNARNLYGKKVDKLKSALEKNKIVPIIFSGGNLNPKDKDYQKQFDNIVSLAEFAKPLGTKYIQITNSQRKGRKAADIPVEELVEYGQKLTDCAEVVKSSSGLVTVYHNHMHQLGETAEEVSTILENTDEKYVKFLLDIAHYTQGGGNAAEAIKRYGKRIELLHMKDVKDDATAKDGYRFVELGQGRVDMASVMDALKAIKYKGYAMIELDEVPVKGRSATESLTISTDFIKTTLKQKI